ncbi:hypothetical protein PF005_g20293 [Phytophthora fragariae]|uniref:Uncharacterized protein n=1 Tax=Phytophthora fragariae TaxID=53985 RepID=A0A6A4CID0_9STRA|nr:hypothetical protein PF003_g19456 [Phytophthora fragariae]KAE8928633.1 hypothetical protein PF009_g21230 [Phytophthora fragariae]KAE8988654.1 hypothetical protein PF011_g19082 [Phytophthora fragariae]KAE9087501.1 hypothetical protein PF007_g20354 [Phytophthora fragariae]KAE9087711.1 hypothetical protein PF010_g19627 [Phytophthora fragariae]
MNKPAVVANAPTTRLASLPSEEDESDEEEEASPPFSVYTVVPPEVVAKARAPRRFRAVDPEPDAALLFAWSAVAAKRSLKSDVAIVELEARPRSKIVVAQMAPSFMVDRP